MRLAGSLVGYWLHLDVEDDLITSTATRARELLGEAAKLFREMGLDHRADTAKAVAR